MFMSANQRFNMKVIWVKNEECRKEIFSNKQNATELKIIELHCFVKIDVHRILYQKYPEFER